MEVASPLTFGHVKAGNKRRFACSPLVDPAMSIDAPMAMDESQSHAAPYGQKLKRRRCDNGEMTASVSAAAASAFHPHGHGGLVIGNKRSRLSEDAHAQDTTRLHLQSIIDRQNAEIQKLREEKATIETSYHQLSASNEKSQNENKVLKKVLAIKQQRQDQFVSELESARRYKEQAEQLIAVLRQHLHAQQSHANGNMGFNTGPPNVF
mmetsp:Transcript_6472/g.9469  ORF Transcript_6472/g.9469 Transcript_6472/m.9469 type:complete len:208 (+) Transcript_6472:125-748(+)